MADRIIGRATIKFVGDTTQLNQAVGAIGNDFGALSRDIKKISGTAFERAIPAIANYKTAISNTRIEWDAYNNSLRVTGALQLQVGEQIKRLRDRTGNIIGTRKVPVYETFGNVSGRIGNLEQILKAEEGVNRLLQAQIPIYQASRQAYRIASADKRQATDENTAAVARLIEAERLEAALSSRRRGGAGVAYSDVWRRNTRQRIRRYGIIPDELRGVAGLEDAPFGRPGATGDQRATALRYLTQQARAFGAAERTAIREVNAARQEEIRTANAAANAEARLAAERQRMGALSQIRRTQRQAVRDAIQVEPESLANLRALQSASPQLYKTLTRAGFPTDPRQQILTNAKISPITRDLVRDVSRVSGSFTDAQGRLTDFSAEFDKSGKMVTRFGGQLRGMGQFLNQTVRDLQKVVEWTIATTVVFGALQGIRSVIELFKEVDTVLTRFTVTAQISREEATQFFSELSRVAIETATPIDELLRSADDIALATKRAGQSTEEWTQKILALSNAVGIYTNLTGTSTEEATDILVSTMKQLNFEAENLDIVLNKIAAAAGGQAQAISDISKGLSVMAEAGKAGGLSLDEMIGTVQTLSQVTSKSPAEVATAFKNLVGAITNPIAKKSLAEYNIALRDSAGETRNILEIYGEIAEKIRQGVIPSGAVQELIRNIAGGPRRAPDAAALLGAIGDIDRVTATAMNASNEAILANAKSLDTLQAKITQFQSQIQSKLYAEYGNEIRSIAEAGIELASTFTGLLGSLKGFLLLLGQLGVAFLAVKVGTKLFGGLAATFGEVVGGIGAVTGSLRVQSIILRQNQLEWEKYKRAQMGGAAGPIPIVPGRETLGIGSRVGRFGVGAAIGGAISAASGGDIADILGGTLTFGGISLMGAGPVGTAVGALSLALGLAIPVIKDFVSGTDDIGKSQKEVSEEMLGALQVYKETLTTYESLTKESKSLGDAIRNARETLSTLTPGTSEYNTTLIALNDYTQKYIKTTYELSDAIQTLADSYEKLTGESSLERFLLTASEIDEKQAKYVRTYLAEIFGEDYGPLQDFDFEKLQNLFSPRQLPQASFQAPGGAVNYGGLVMRGREDFERDIKLLGDLFDFNNMELKPDVQIISQEQVDLIREFRQEFLDSLDPSKVEQAAATFDNFFANYAGVENSLLQITSLQAYIASAPLFNSQAFPVEDAQKFVALLKAVQSLYTKALDLGPEGEESARTLEYITQDLAKFILETGKLPSEGVLKGYFTQLGNVFTDIIPDPSNLEPSAVEAMAFLNDLFGGGLDIPVHLDTSAVSEEALELADELTGFTDDLTDELGGKFADLQARILGGEFEDNASGLAELRAQYEALADRLPDLAASMEAIAEGVKAGEFDEAALDAAFASAVLGEGLEQLPGLQGLANDGFAEGTNRLIEYADQLGITGQGMDIFIDGLIKLQERAVLVGKAWDNLHGKMSELAMRIKILIDKGQLQQAIAVLQASRQYYSFMSARTGEPIGDISAIDEMLAALIAARDGGGGGAEIRAGASTGRGTSLGSAPKTGKAKGPDVSTLDIPEIIANAANRDALLQEAIRRARALQSTIPGATKDARNDIVELLDGTKNILEVTGIKSDLLRKALQELADIEKKRLEMETKADTIRRIRVGSGSFAAFANVPLNSQTGVSVGSPQGPIAININVNGQVLTPAQMAELANMIGAALKNQIANGG